MWYFLMEFDTSGSIFFATIVLVEIDNSSNCMGLILVCFGFLFFGGIVFWCFVVSQLWWTTRTAATQTEQVSFKALNPTQFWKKIAKNARDSEVENFKLQKT